MHYRDLSIQTAATQPPLDYHHAARLIIEQQFAADRPTTGKHLIDCPDLVPQRFRTRAEFHRAVAIRKEWCRRYAYGGHTVEALGGDADQKGLRFRFSRIAVANLFNLLHATWGTRSSKRRA